MQIIFRELYGFNDRIIILELEFQITKLPTVVVGDQKAPFSIATTPKCCAGRYSVTRIAPLCT